MNKVDFMGALLDSGMTPEDIYAFAQEQVKDKIAATKARKNLETAIGEYVRTIAPWIKVEEIDFKEIEKYLIDLEKVLQDFRPMDSNPAPTQKEQKAKKKNSDEALARFLVSLGV